MALGRKIQKELQTFFQKHPDETFYVIVIDAGYLNLNSEEAFEKQCERYAARWEEETRPVTAAEIKACDEDEIEDHYHSFAFRRSEGESFDSALAVENESRSERRAEGNPYRTPGSKKRDRLRYGPGNFAYSQIIDLGLEDEYQAHYETESDRQATTKYAKKVSAILADLEDSKATLLAGVKVSTDFRIFSVEHEL